ncbi:uncharacterized protein N7498_005048 [Penicillium cinerascens]|uniref:DUF7730 domain-containing protein n=1 Tax=Penicillium cinerascens TaxID=70096 RepID=A0A9W9SZS5_9EURO|nr:uncharacterized protein N7498_005048 [Penicillium cinerascens]KAJ5204169.1 hypothetical protein N7498_005048 [Penicillium cinerascens]
MTESPEASVLSPIPRRILKEANHQETLELLGKMESDSGILISLSTRCISEGAISKNPAANTHLHLTSHDCGLLGIPSPDGWEWLLCSASEHTRDSEIALFKEEKEEADEEDGHVSDDGIDLLPFSHFQLRAGDIALFQGEGKEERGEEYGHDSNSDFDLSTFSHFQLLPGEIRQKIYDYVFENFGALIERDRSNKQSKCPSPYRLTHRYPQLNRHHMPSKERLPLGLVFSCKRIYNETILQLYKHTCFTFDTTKALRRFLQKVSPEAKAVIQRVQLKHIFHNRTHLESNRIWQLKSNAAWKAVCQRMADEFTSLRRLYIEVTVPRTTRLTVNEPWCEPYMTFCGPDGKGRLEWVHAWAQIVVSGHIVPRALNAYKQSLSPRLHAVSVEIERRLMTNDAFQKKQLADMGEQKGNVMVAYIAE